MKSSILGNAKGQLPCTELEMSKILVVIVDSVPIRQRETQVEDELMIVRRLLLALFCCLSFSATAQSGGAMLPRTSDAAGKVDLVEGDVRIYDTTKKPRIIKVGDGIAEGESIVTGGDGELHMKMADGGYIAVRPNTKMRIAAFRAQGDDNDKGVFGLLVGSFRSITGWIGKYNSRNYRINTPTATIGVRGTDHEPMVIPEGSQEGEAGTYDKVNIGGSFIQTTHGRVDVGERQAAFAPHAGTVAPRVLGSIPRFFQATRNEHLLEPRHEAIQRSLDKGRDERRRAMEQRQAAHSQPVDHRPSVQSRPNLRQEARNQRQEWRREGKQRPQHRRHKD
jgi:hypothetical protein